MTIKKTLLWIVLFISAVISGVLIWNLDIGLRAFQAAQEGKLLNAHAPLRTGVF